MLWFLLTLLFLILLLLWLPLKIEIATEQNVYQAKWSGVGGFRAVPTDAGWRWFIRIFFWETEIKPGQTGAKNKSEPQKTKKKKEAKRFTAGQAFYMVKGIFRAVRIKRFWIDWDSDDFLLNAWLYPLSRIIGRGKYRFNVNFLGRQEASILLQTRPLRLGWAFLRTFFHTKRKKP